MKVSVITINYNNLAGLKKTVQSVMQQNCKEAEHLIIDGGSADGSKEFILEHQHLFAYWVSEKDKGIYDAMNKGILNAKGTYLLFLNSGDYLYQPGVLKKVLPELTVAPIVYGDMKIDIRGKLKSGYMPDVLSVEHMIQDTLWHPVTFVQKQLFLDHGLYSTRYAICGDYDFFFKMLVQKKIRTKHIHQFVSVFAFDGMSSNPANKDKIESERTTIQNTYLSESERMAYKSRKPKKNWVQHIKSLFR